MAGISSKAAGKLENEYGYNGNEIQKNEFSDGGGLELYDFNARTYDYQTGRFLQIDPETEEDEQESLSPFHFAFNNPIKFNDPDGRNPVLPIAFRIWRILRSISAAKEITKTLSRKTTSPVQTPMVITRDAFGNIVAVKESGFIQYTLNQDAIRLMIEKKEKDDKANVVREQAKELQGEISSLESGIKNHEQTISEHEQKLEEYKTNPDKHDNKGQLQGVSKEIRDKRIQGRINKLEKELKNQREALKKDLHKLSDKKKELEAIQKNMNSK
jgi:RHS repeat-associated protein